MAKTLVLGLMLGIAAVAGGAEAHAATVLEAGRKIAPTAPEPALVPVRLKRHGLHRGFGRVHESFRSPRSFAGKRLRHGGVIVRKGLVDPRFSASKPPRARGVSSKGGLVDLRQISRKRFGDGAFGPGKGLVGRQLFSSQRLRAGRALVTKRSVGPPILNKRLENRPLVFKRCGKHSVVVTTGLVGAKLFLGKRFGRRGVLIRKGFAGKAIGPRTCGRLPHRADR